MKRKGFLAGVRRRLERFSLAGTWGSVARSLTVRCLAVGAVYAGVIALAVALIAQAVDDRITYAFPDFTDIEPYEDEIFNGTYDVLASPALDGCESLVFGEGGEQLYASSKGFTKAIRPEDLDLIGSYHDYDHFLLFEEEADGQPGYRVIRVGLDNETGVERISSYALLDRDLNVVGGSLFKERKALTPREFGLLMGIYDPTEKGLATLPDRVASQGGAASDDAAADGGYRFSGTLTNEQYVICKFAGTDDAGEKRVLVFATPTVDQGSYRDVTDEAQSYWLLLLPVGGIATALLMWAEVRIIRAATLPLSNAIEAYGECGQIDIDRADVATELRPVLDGFCEVADDLAHAQAEKQRMIADISHDIKTPLTVIRGYAQAFRDGMVPAERERAYARALCEKAERAGSMVDQLSAYAAMERPEYVAARVPCDAAQVVRDVCAGLVPLVQQRGCTLAERLPQEPVLAELDRELVRRLLTNLVGNSVVHNEPGTRIEVQCALVDAGARLRLRVVDDGRGVPPELAQRLFDPFVTSNKERAVDKGTGLGLAIARRCAELLGGSIALVDAEQPWSTCFEVRLPLR